LAGSEKNSLISQTQFHLVYDLLHKSINPFMELVIQIRQVIVTIEEVLVHIIFFMATISFHRVVNNNKSWLAAALNQNTKLFQTQKLRYNGFSPYFMIYILHYLAIQSYGVMILELHISLLI